MPRLTAYLLKQFTRDALSLYLLAAFLVFITQMLRLFDLISAKGQDMLTLAGQAFLTTPPLAREILYICMGVGVARALRALQASRELHTIHVSRSVGAIPAAVALFAAGGLVAVTLLAHWIEPASRRAAAEWSADIAADLLGRTLTPGRFTEVSDGVVLRIEGRAPDGTIIGFFADDSRSRGIRRTYIADNATVVTEEDGIQLSLRDGSVQMHPRDGRYSEVVFERYELAIDSLTERIDPTTSRQQRTTLELLPDVTPPSNNQSAWAVIHQRTAESFRVAAMVALVAALAAFPHARRGRVSMPLEIVVLALAFAERPLSVYAANAWHGWYYLGAGLMALGAVAVLAWRLLPSALGARRQPA